MLIKLMNLSDEYEPKEISSFNSDVVPKIGERIVTNEYNGKVESVVHRYDLNCVLLGGHFKLRHKVEPKCIYNTNNKCCSGYDSTIGPYCMYCTGNRVVDRALSELATRIERDKNR